MTVQTDMAALFCNSSARAHSQNAPTGLSAATQLLLLIDGRSAHIGVHGQNHASMVLTEQTDMAELLLFFYRNGFKS